jgi:hypothetical protein
MPDPQKLPKSLKALPFRHNVELTHARWESDLRPLFKVVRRYVGVEEQQSIATYVKAGAKNAVACLENLLGYRPRVSTLSVRMVTTEEEVHCVNQLGRGVLERGT